MLRRPPWPERFRFEPDIGAGSRYYRAFSAEYGAISDAHWQLEDIDTERPPLFAKSFSVKSDFGDDLMAPSLGE
jgi:hypothetical protein